MHVCSSVERDLKLGVGRVGELRVSNCRTPHISKTVYKHLNFIKLNWKRVQLILFQNKPVKSKTV